MPTAPDRPPVPSAPLWLGAGGLVPFVVLAGAIWVAPEPFRPALYDWLRSYAAVILSFIGAVHWGIALAHRDMSQSDRAVVMGWSVVPALVAWVGLVMSLRAGITLTAAMFVAHYTMDRQLAARFPLPDWYLRLRAGLTVVVVACLAVATIR